MKTLRGHLLIASPDLPDPNFCRSVVLIVDHDGEGAFGLILNRTTKRNLCEFFPNEDDVMPDDLAVAIGGPVPGPILILHGDEENERSDQVIPNVYLTKTEEDFYDVFDRMPAPYRVFVGYSGWGSGQLEIEMQSGSWLTLPATYDDIFSIDEGELWDVLVSRAQALQTQRVLKIKKIGNDPSLN